ncbi:MAG TPA: glycosyltransferase family 2 protein [Pseudonocardiaceae bacterium]
MSNPGPAIAVVIVTYNSADVLGACLDALPAGCAGVRLTEVVVVDNVSADGTVALARTYADRLPMTVVETGRNGGYAAGINAGYAALERSGHDLDAVLVLNADITMRPGAVARLATELERPGAGIAVPRLVNPDGSLQPSLRRRPSLARAVAESVIGGRRAARIRGLSELILDPGRYEQPGTAAWATGAAMLISTEASADVGAWDESFLLYSEETDFALRAADRGWQLRYQPASVMAHVSGDAFVTNPMLGALLVVNKVRLFRRRAGRVHGALYHAAVTVGALVRAAAGNRIARAALVALLVPSRRLRSLPG